MKKTKLVITLATVVFLAACDVGNNSHINLRNYGYPNRMNQRKMRLKNYYQTNIDANYVVSSCQELMEDEMGFPKNGQWSSVEDITKTQSGWQWQGWVEFDGERNNFLCNVDNNEVVAYPYKKEIYPDSFPDNLSESKNLNASSVVTSCQEFMAYEMGFPKHGNWSSQKDVRKTRKGWEWQGWVDLYGERNKFVCTVDNNGVGVSTNFEDSYNYEYEYNYTY
ncbi:hypothetical protein Tery_2823 [Trichodesmium erythraeum IMS101]|uniref:Lipoprotein n=1 Tax=Trichodesmium erythraeum (strain IMS101) TaxID=203124 RepID=Q110S5_TRIEI|nr:hypothetical protein [Trichodesmium erythraeum GBRTRLIN201]MCH2050515.1 hypothetical protein [Trichodesmium sp. ALOHA_ZT_67]MDE5094230.1 hypothetical protein [Trichodesmium sp. St11_bin5]